MPSGRAPPARADSARSAPGAAVEHDAPSCPRRRTAKLHEVRHLMGKPNPPSPFLRGRRANATDHGIADLPLVAHLTDDSAVFLPNTQRSRSRVHDAVGGDLIHSQQEIGDTGL